MNKKDRDSAPASSAATAESKARVAFFGGSFDPPHLGHLAAARAAHTAFQLDSVLFAPVGTQPLKNDGSAASFADRLAMTRLAIEGETGFAISLADAPKPSGEPNFTFETLRDLRAQLGPGSELFCLMGADSFLGLKRWHRAGEIPFVASLIVASRPGDPLDGLQAAMPQGLALEPATVAEKFGFGVEVRSFLLFNSAGESAQFHVMPGLDVEISASEIRRGIRRRLRGGPEGALERPAAEPRLLPDAVAEYIGARELYR
jgi:nicotinate-nucleotide adenylyltransferase